MSREMKDSGVKWIGDIPTSWEIVPNKFIMKKEKTINPRYSNELILSLTMDGVIIRDLEAGGKIPVSFDGYQRVEAGNLLMCLFDIDVTPRCIGLIETNGVTSPAYSQFITSHDNYSPYYNYYYLYLDNDKLLLPLAKNLRHSFTEDELGKIPTVRPPYSEQIQIANFLDSQCSKIDQLSANLSQQIEVLQEYKKSVITQAVTKGLEPEAEMKDSGIEWIGDIPSSWDISPLKHLFEIRKRIAGREGPTVLSITQSGIKPKDIWSNKGQLAESYANYQLIYTGEFGMNHMDLLTGGIDISQYNGVISPDYRVFASKRSDTCDNYFLYFFTMCYKSRIFYSMGQGAALMGRWRLPASNFLNMKLPLPPVEEQKRIANYLDKRCKQIDTQISNLTGQKSTLVSYKKSIIFDYVTGKKEVPASFFKENNDE